jgi:RimK-like ATP-grasp domain
VIVAVTHRGDDHAAPVLAALAVRGTPAVVVDTAAFPQHAAIRLRYGEDGASDLTLALEGGPSVSAREIEAVWWRRPLPAELHPGVSDPDHRRFAWEECDAALSGFWLAIEARWVNHPSRYLEVSRKPYQLRAAQEAGLEVPRTLLTNDPGAARAFVEELGGPGRVVFKTFTGTEKVWRETRLVRSEEVPLLDAVRFAPVIFQEYVPGCDVRATVVGEQVFAARIDARESASPVDWRLDVEHTRIEPMELPRDVAGRLLALHRALGLLYGACDLRETADGRYAFLEVNPAGQWLFVEVRAGLPISGALADLLALR